MVKTFNGKDVDISALKEKNPHKLVLGNTNYNANGDLIGKGGKILKTRQQLMQEYYESNPKAVQKTTGLNKDSIKDIINMEKEIVNRDKINSNEYNLSKSTKPDVTVTFMDQVDTSLSDVETSLAQFEIEDDSSEEKPKRKK